jgi:hypothetical protein
MVDTDKDKQTQAYLAGALGRVIEKEKGRGLFKDTAKRWDEKDEKEFAKMPVTELLDNPYYLGMGQYRCRECGWRDKKQKKPKVCPDCGRYVGPDLFPVHRQDILSLWDARKATGALTAVFQEGIGSGKTTKFCTILWLLITEVITKIDPVNYYNLSEKGQGISFVCMSRNESLAREVTFLTVLPYFNCSFYNDYFPPQIDVSAVMASRKFPSRLRFPKRIVLFPGTGSALSAIGYNLFGGGIDEANYLEVVDESKKVFSGKRYDAADSMYSAIIARMKSRFDPVWLRRQKKLPGLLVMFSNPRYSGDFTSRMERRSRLDKTVFFRKRCTWEAHPKNRFSGKTFRFDVYNRRILT